MVHVGRLGEQYGTDARLPIELDVVVAIAVTSQEHLPVYAT